MKAPSAPDLLRDDDMTVLRLLAKGSTGRGVARELGIAPATAQRRIRRLRTIFGVATTIEAVAAAARSRLV
jgi:DNA-binding NarL/FixJ family response regulator